jgi:hypothetical protein
MDNGAMKRVRYGKYEGGLADELSMEDLLKALSDYLLDSGFRNPMMEFQDLDKTMDDLKEALRRAMESSDLFDEQTQQKIDQLEAEGKLDELLDQIMDRMEQENYIQQQGAPSEFEGQGQAGQGEGEARFEVTERASTSSASTPCATCSARSASPALAGMTRATLPQASKRAAAPSPTSSAMCSTSTPPQP